MVMGSQPFQTRNPLEELLEENEQGRRALFFGGLGNLSPFQQRFANSLYEPTFNRFLGQIGQQVRSGQTPNTTWSDFLRNSFNFNREQLSAPQSTSHLFGRPQFFFGQRR